MIRRRTGNSFALIRQVDHAAIAGQLAERIGTRKYERPRHFETLVAATRLHDSGWGVHDDAPQLNAQGFPLDLFEMPASLDVACWSGAPAIAASAGPRAELLVSLHILALSGYLAARPPNPSTDAPADQGTRDRFDLNKFQHREIERQERLRREMGLPTDLPLTMGLAEEGASQDEDEIRRDLRWLQAMDLISLAVCCNEPPKDQTPDIYASIGEIGEPLRLRREADDLVVSPWPFAVERIALDIPASLVPAHPYASPAVLPAGYPTFIRSFVRAY